MGRSRGTFKHAVAKKPTVKKAPTINKIWLKNMAASGVNVSGGKTCYFREKQKRCQNFNAAAADFFAILREPFGSRIKRMS
jgi:hypothetical protein